MAAISHEILKRCLRYEPETGRFIWLVNIISGRGKIQRPVGSTAGCFLPEGYVGIRIHGRRYQAHVLAWFYTIGEWPKFDIDHINLNRSDNRWSNLRPASRSENNANSRVRSSNKLGIKGVRRHVCGKFEANIAMNGKQKYLGLFNTMEEASEAYNLAAKEIHRQFARIK